MEVTRQQIDAALLWYFTLPRESNYAVRLGRLNPAYKVDSMIRTMHTAFDIPIVAALVTVHQLCITEVK